jgi:hypothetical protein
VLKALSFLSAEWPRGWGPAALRKIAESDK